MTFVSYNAGHECAMEKILDFIRGIKSRNEKVLVFGAGKTGIAVAKFFVNIGAEVEVWDQIPRTKFLKFPQNAESLNYLENIGVRFCFDSESKTVDNKVSLLVPSPGISPKSALFKIEGVEAVPKIGELELGMEIFSEAYAAKQIVVTGSNGKSTTTALIHHILKSLNLNSILCGNIGEPIIEKVPADVLDNVRNDERILTIEASSYQLEDCKRCKPDVAVMLNLTENHLERHGDMASYLEAKKNLVRRFDEDSTIVINADDTSSNQYIKDSESQILHFGASSNCAARIDFESKQIKFASENFEVAYVQDRGHLMGGHNLYNIAAAILACHAVGCELQKSIDAAYEFLGLEHRLEKISVGTCGLAINDSKATTVSASLAACKAVVESGLKRKILLLLGGEEKSGSDWAPMVNYISQNASEFKQLCLFGACREKLRLVFATTVIPTELFESLSSAVPQLKIRLGADSLILLSPGCASFDEFTDFEDRGRSFKGLLAG